MDLFTRLADRLNDLLAHEADSAWSELATALGGEQVGATIVVPVGVWSVVLDVERRRPLATPGEVLCTRLRAACLQRDSFRFAVFREGALGALERLGGLGPTPLGDPTFDDQFVLLSNDAAKARLLLGQAGLREHFAAQGEAGLELRPGTLVYQELAEVRDVPRLRQLLALMSQTLDALVRVGYLAAAPPGAVALDLPREQPVACFFCGRPLLPARARVGAFTLDGAPLRPIVCEPHAAALAANQAPAVRGRAVADAVVPWFQDATYQPAWDYDPAVHGPEVAADALPAPDVLFVPLPTVVVHADDARWIGNVEPTAAPPPA